MPSEVYWCGDPPPACQLSGAPFNGVMYDANLPGVGWGNFNEATFKRYGGRLGTGFGQKYEQQADGRWKKVAG